jgi:hypothetical protein
MPIENHYGGWANIGSPYFLDPKEPTIFYFDKDDFLDVWYSYVVYPCP